MIALLLVQQRYFPPPKSGHALQPLTSAAETEAPLPKLDDNTDETCASIPADATSEVSPDPVSKEADVETPIVQPTTEESHTEDAVGDPIAVQDTPDPTDHDVVAANVALAEAENSSAPDMPAKKVPQVVCVKLQLLLNFHLIDPVLFKAVY